MDIETQTRVDDGRKDNDIYLWDTDRSGCTEDQDQDMKGGVTSYIKIVKQNEMDAGFKKGEVSSVYTTLRRIDFYYYTS